MKNILKLIAMLLILTSSFTCEKTETEIDDIVPYAPCSCEDKEQANLIFSPGEALLFKDYIPEQIQKEMHEELYQEGNKTGLKWIVYDSKTDTVCLYVGLSNMLCIHEICNYPDFAKEWNIPQNGQKVYYDGIAYQPCSPKGGIASVSYFDYVLTNFKRIK
jgi:hypothetical protein